MVYSGEVQDNEAADLHLKYPQPPRFFCKVDVESNKADMRRPYQDP